MKQAISFVLLALVLAGCATEQRTTVVDQVNEATGESFTRMREPLSLAIDRPDLSKVGKDYLLVAPVTIAGSANTGQYLWFGLGTTLDRAITGAPQPGIDRIVLMVDGVPMTFDLVRWQEAANTEPYDVSMKMTHSFASKVTDNQLRRIAGAETLTAYVTNPDHRSPVYDLVSGVPGDWLDF
jgi:hypothetical protein